ncbi:MAG: hypothetical protein ABEI97_04490 [Candidatus Nanohaloarchaea archaeon]
MNTNKLGDAGFLIVATGDEFVEQAELAAKRVKQVTDYPVALISDRDPGAECFDSVIPIEDPVHGFGDKPYNIHRTPFDRTILIDADFYVSERTTELFRLLDDAEMAACLDERNMDREETRELFDDVPLAFPECNTGLIAFRNTDTVQALFEQWRDLYSPDHVNDQKSFLAALYRSDVDFTAISGHYNVIASNHVRGTVHGIHDIWNEVHTLERVEQRFEKYNKERWSRFLVRNTATIIAAGDGLLDNLFAALYDRALYTLYLRDRSISSLKERGLSATLIRGVRFVTPFVPTEPRE